MTEVVLDASAVIALLRAEIGADRVAAAIPDSRISAVNLGEVVQKFVDLGVDEAGILAMIGDLPCTVEPFDEALAIRTGLLRRSTRSRGLSLGDRACLALAEREALPVLTADKTWAGLDLGLEIVLIR